MLLIEPLRMYELLWYDCRWTSTFERMMSHNLHGRTSPLRTFLWTVVQSENLMLKAAIFFYFHAVFDKNNRLTHPLWELAPSPPPVGKSWVRHWGRSLDISFLRPKIRKNGFNKGWKWIMNVIARLPACDILIKNSRATSWRKTVKRYLKLFPKQKLRKVTI